jgi:hypothetical protein
MEYWKQRANRYLSYAWLILHKPDSRHGSTFKQESRSRYERPGRAMKGYSGAGEVLELLDDYVSCHVAEGFG